MFQSCKGQENTKQTITRMEKVDFTSLEGTSIYFRSKGHRPNTDIYFLNVFDGICSPYSIEVDKLNLDSLIINNDLVIKSCGQDYLDDDKLKRLIRDYLKLDVCFVKVDGYGNVYINPKKQEPPILLKINEESPPKDLNQFEHYQDSWYIRK